jgi:hypothetical protein
MSAEGVAMTDVSKELLPCPFCATKLQGYETNSGEQFYIHSDAANCVIDGFRLSTDDIARWNNRHNWHRDPIINALAEAAARGELESQRDEMVSTRTPAPSDVVERVAFAIFGHDWDSLPHLKDAECAVARKAISAMGVSDEVEMREAREQLFQLALAAGELVTATDGIERLRDQRRNVLWEMKQTELRIVAIDQALAPSDSGDIQ